MKRKTPKSWNGNGMTKTFMNWIFWALLSAFLPDSRQSWRNRGDGHRFKPGHGGTHHGRFAFYVGSIAFCVNANATAALSKLSHRAWISLLLSGIATGLSWLCYFRALQLGEASRVAPVDKLSVVFAILFAALLLREKVGWQQWLGRVVRCGWRRDPCSQIRL